MFCWPCISIHLCNKNQLDALFILSIFRQSASTCFGHIFSPSSGGILYIYNNWYVLYIYSIPPDDGLKICPKHVEADWRNILRINSASSWFLLHRFELYVSGLGRMHDRLMRLVPLIGWDGKKKQLIAHNIGRGYNQVPLLLICKLEILFIIEKIIERCTKAQTGSRCVALLFL